MRKPLIALVAALSLVIVGILVAAPKMTNNTRIASQASAGFDIVDIIRKARDLPEQNYQAH